jgi:hypothetical protein
MSTGREQAAARLVAILRDNQPVAYRPSLLKEVARGVQQSPPPQPPTAPMPVPAPATLTSNQSHIFAAANLALNRHDQP